MKRFTAQAQRARSGAEKRMVEDASAKLCDLRGYAVKQMATSRIARHWP